MFERRGSSFSADLSGRSMFWSYAARLFDGQGRSEARDIRPEASADSVNVLLQRARLFTFGCK